jgi:beta-galactosidase/beta-glucuronidase
MTSLHPCPQFARAHWVDLCGTWTFAYDDHNRGISDHWYTQTAPFDRDIIVPFPPESRLSGIHDTGFHPTVWYRRTFALTDDLQAGRLLLHFGAVDYRAMVWVNGQLVAQHEGGHTPFTADISHVLDATLAEQVIVVRADDDPFDLSQPRGKQYWQKVISDIWYERTTGIWQPVWLEAVPQTYLQKIRFTPFADDAALGVEIQLNQVPASATLTVKVAFGDTVMAEDTYTLHSKTLARRMELPLEQFGIQRHRILWSPEHPHLLDVTLTLTDDDNGQDIVQSYAGLRSVSTQNGQFFLNNHPYYLRMVLEQGYYPESHLAAPNEQALKEEVEWIKRLGFNGVRVHQKIEDPRFLYWCDKVGVIVWGEMANAYEFTTTAVNRHVREWLEAVERDYSHPCIVAWVPLNESWGVPHLRQDPAQQAFIRTLADLTRSLDKTRLVIGNDGWEFVAGDIIGIHDYNLNGQTLRLRYSTPEEMQRTLKERTPGNHVLVIDEKALNGQPIMLTEFGGVAFEENRQDGWGYGKVRTKADYVAKYAELVNALYASEQVAGYCYTQLTDTEQEINGLLDEHRRPKVDPALIAAINKRQPYTIPAEYEGKGYENASVSTN